jgi:diguanylate cyclase (GGDEF)-like protein
MQKDEFADREWKVLVVDDEPSIREIITFNLEIGGYLVESVNNGEEAIFRALQNRPDLILLDVMLPKMDGIEVIKALRSNFRTSGIPIILVTAKRDIHDKVAGMRVGADDYITKPFSREELLARVKMVLRRTSEMRDRNPLSNLPGNISIELDIQRRLKSKEGFSLFYLDIDNFKPYNDRYGYTKGDQAIQLLAEVLLAMAEKFCAPGDLIGHVGGDDFVVVTSIQQADQAAHFLLSEFSVRSIEFFSDEDRAAGYFTSISRSKETKQYPCCLTLSLAIIENYNNRFTSYGQLVDVATELKAYAKSKGGNRFVKERRSDVRSGNDGNDRRRRMG